jgi:hypothetical protein
MLHSRRPSKLDPYYHNAVTMHNVWYSAALPWAAMIVRKEEKREYGIKRLSNARQTKENP